MFRQRPAFVPQGCSRPAPRRTLGVVSGLILAGLALTGFGAEEPRPLTPDAHTLVLLHFDEMQGTVAKDASGRGHHATLEKPPRRPRWYKHGLFGGCLAFDGKNEDADGDKLGDADGLILPKGGAPDPRGAGFTVELWVRHARLLGTQYYASHNDAAGRYYFLASSGRLQMGFIPENPKRKWLSVSTRRSCLVAGVWHHVAFTYDGKTGRIFCDGAEVAKGEMTGGITSNMGETYIGHRFKLRPHKIHGFNGLMDEVRISNVARTSFPKGPWKPRHPFPSHIKLVKQYIEPEPVVRDVTVEGVVFDDRNGNGKRDRGERGIRGVWVTDGARINLSDAGGAYNFSFRVDEYRMVYITLPNGYKATGPWWHLIEQDGKKTDYVFNFALQRDRASLDRNFSFLVTADSQFSTKKEGVWLKEDMAQITRTTGNPRFHFIVGDLTMTGWYYEWKWYAEAIRQLTIPCYNVYGGHGGNYGSATRLKTASVHHFNQFVGPSYYSWNYGGRHFLCYNSWGGLSRGAQKRQEKWVRADLATLKPGTEVIQMAHTPFALSKWRKDLKPVACFYGHWHENELYHYQGVPYMCTTCIRGKDWGSFTRTVRHCEFRNGKLITELRPTGQYKRVEFINPQADGELSRGRRPLRVMAFDTASRVTQVNATILSGGERVADISLKKLGLFTWGTEFNTSRIAPGAYELRVAVKDDRPETWPQKKCAFKVTGRSPARASTGSDWPMFFKSLKELRTTQDQLNPPLELVWSVHTGGQNQLASSPIVYRGRVYLGTENVNLGHAKHEYQCYEGATGRRVWATKVDSYTRVSLAAADGHIYGQTAIGTVYCLDAGTGRVAWKTAMWPEQLRPNVTKCAILLHKGRVIGYSEYGQVTILDAQTGKKLASWKRPRGARTYFGGPFPDGDRIWMPTLGTAHCLDLMTGKPIWSAPKAGKLCARGVAMGIAQDGVYYLRGFRGAAAYRASDGKMLWEAMAHVLGGVPVPTIADGVLYAGGSDMPAINIKTGDSLWRYAAMRPPDKNNQRQTFAGQSGPLVSGDLVYVGRDDGDLVALDRRTGKRVWRFANSLPIKSSPVVSGNMLFVCDFDGNLHAFVGRTH